MPDRIEVAGASSVADVAIPGAAEVMLATVTINVHKVAPLILVLAWVKITLGATVTAVTPRIRRGAAITDTLVGEATSEAIKTAAGSTEPFEKQAIDNPPANAVNVTYGVSALCTGATGAGTCTEATIVAIEL